MIDFTHGSPEEHEFEQASMKYLFNVTMSSKISYENDVNTIRANLRSLDSNSVIASKFSAATINDLNTTYYSDRYEGALRKIRIFMD